MTTEREKWYRSAAFQEALHETRSLRRRSGKIQSKSAAPRASEPKRERTRPVQSREPAIKKIAPQKKAEKNFFVSLGAFIGFSLVAGVIVFFVLGKLYPVDKMSESPVNYEERFPEFFGYSLFDDVKDASIVSSQFTGKKTVVFFWSKVDGQAEDWLRYLAGVDGASVEAFSIYSASDREQAARLAREANADGMPHVFDQDIRSGSNRVGTRFGFFETPSARVYDAYGALLTTAKDPVNLQTFLNEG